ncbi:unnamed protein product [Dracunculus medinensis]|uniref:t-SNARE coiled-coil homology domain-containing protein n=1 Tax=Dracunculus medinensis TaxID=318479 RepID=A0A0N4UAA8_DRAME|nr:unnamed protein product [Dracunculus medinensis]
MVFIDDEIKDIQTTIKEIHKALFKVDKHLDKALPMMEEGIKQFNQVVRGIVKDINTVRNGTINIASKFPSRTIYIALLIFIDIFLWIFVLLLIFYLIKSLRNYYCKSNESNDDSKMPLKILNNLRYSPNHEFNSSSIKASSSNFIDSDRNFLLSSNS